MDELEIPNIVTWMEIGQAGRKQGLESVVVQDAGHGSLIGDAAVLGDSEDQIVSEGVLGAQAIERRKRLQAGAGQDSLPRNPVAAPFGGFDRMMGRIRQDPYGFITLGQLDGPAVVVIEHDRAVGVDQRAVHVDITVRPRSP